MRRPNANRSDSSSRSGMNLANTKMPKMPKMSSAGLLYRFRPKVRATRRMLPSARTSKRWPALFPQFDGFSETSAELA